MAPGKLSANENRIKHSTGVPGKPFSADFLFGPDLNAIPQPVRMDEILHEFDLIDACGQKNDVNSVSIFSLNWPLPTSLY